MARNLIEFVRRKAVQRFEMNIKGTHGLKHWERVRENGIYLCKHSGGDQTVAEIFAYVHDCCREFDFGDPEHGLRASQFVEELGRKTLKLDGDRFGQLKYACEYHEKGLVSEDPTIGSCWDADRLDLGRVGRRPNLRFLSTPRARLESVIDWAYMRSRGHKARIKV